jgi:hypothetical protein
MIELRCPESCQYLSAARSETAQRENELRGKELLEEGRMPYDLNNREKRLVDEIFDAIARAHRGVNGPKMSDLIDPEILDALENAIKNLETETSGIIYEHHAATPRIEEVSRRIRADLDQLAKGIIAEQRPKRSEMINALKFMRDKAQAHIRRNEGSQERRGFLRFVMLYVPWPEQETSRLIIAP